MVDAPDVLAAHLNKFQTRQYFVAGKYRSQADERVDDAVNTMMRAWASELLGGVAEQRYGLHTYLNACGYSNSRSLHETSTGDEHGSEGFKRDPEKSWKDKLSRTGEGMERWGGGGRGGRKIRQGRVAVLQCLRS